MIITEEGKKYIENGLPEENLAELAENNPITIQEAKNKIENFSIALSWAKKKNLIDIDKGKIIFKKHDDSNDLDLLKKIEKGEDVSEDDVEKLLKRKLVSIQTDNLEKKAKKYIGKNIDFLNEELIKTGLWERVKLKPFNIETKGKEIFPGKRQPYQDFLKDLRDKLVKLGFQEMSGPNIELEFWNFDALFQPQNHPARDWTDTYKLKYPTKGFIDKNIMKNVKGSHEKGWKYKWSPEKAMKLMPRAHGTAISARKLSTDAEIPGKYFAIARCFRPDVLDATHLIEFNQIEGIVLDKNITLKNLLGVLEMFAKEIAGAEEIRFYPDYYPFTEPSVQISAKHPKLGWVEFGGAGIFREEVTKPLGIDVPVIAWGIGVDRLAMFKMGIKDIRYLFSDDLKWLREKSVI